MYVITPPRRSLFLNNNVVLKDNDSVDNVCVVFFYQVRHGAISILEIIPKYIITFLRCYVRLLLALTLHKIVQIQKAH